MAGGGYKSSLYACSRVHATVGLSRRRHGDGVLDDKEQVVEKTSAYQKWHSSLLNSACKCIMLSNREFAATEYRDPNGLRTLFSIVVDSHIHVVAINLFGRTQHNTLSGRHARRDLSPPGTILCRAWRSLAAVIRCRTEFLISHRHEYANTFQYAKFDTVDDHPSQHERHRWYPQVYTWEQTRIESLHAGMHLTC